MVVYTVIGRRVSDNPYADCTDLGKITYNGPNHTITYNGFTPDVIKSALQKYCRRGCLDKALASAFELYGLKRLSETGAKAIVTNMYHRIGIIAAEDIGPANLPLCIAVVKMMNENIQNPEYLAASVHLMVLSEKSRLMDEAWYAFMMPEGRRMATRMGYYIEDDKYSYTEADRLYIETHKEDPEIFQYDDPEELKSILLLFRKRLEEKEYNAFSWLYIYTQETKDLKVSLRSKFAKSRGKGAKTRSPMILIWRVLALFLPYEVCETLGTAYFELSENSPFISVAILAILFSLPYTSFCLEAVVETWSTCDVLKQLVNNDYYLEIDDYVIDKHTRQGRSRGYRHFVEEGSLITNPSNKYTDPRVKEIYDATLLAMDKA